MRDPVAEKYPTTPISLRQKVYEQIKHEIITCRLAPGEPLSEGQFVDRFQVSKTPIREALTSLQQDRLVEYIANRGFSVTSISLRDIQEIFEARAFYECTLFQWTMKYITQDEIDRLESFAHIEYNLGDTQAIENYLQANLEFHLTIARMARNSRIYWHYNSLMNEAQRLIFLDFKNSNILPAWHTSHSGITQALRTGDTATGIRSIQETLELAKKRILGT
jgi:DNA-binding GntR family transcriptional regulator